MSLPALLVTLTALAAQCLSASVSGESAEKPTESSVETFDSYAVQNHPQQLPLLIQLPREEAGVPFYPGEPVPYLRAPQYVANPQPDSYQVPVPSEYLAAPTEGVWNPNDDPTLYYELPASITKENIPTNQYPKKFNKDVHSKSKPFAVVPKKEIVLEPINESQFVQRQKDLYKTIENLNKKENQKNIEQEKVPILITTTKPRKIVNNSKVRSKSKDNKLQQKEPSKATNNSKLQTDSSKSETTIGQNYDSKPEYSDHNKFTKGLSPHITDSLGLSSSSSHHGNNGGQKERLLFHMVGHDGPMSYKWGYDTGKGHNRQFRFEERDKEGVVKGQFGYYDKEGKFRMMNYNAHPDHGFHMEPAAESEINE